MANSGKIFNDALAALNAKNLFQAEVLFRKVLQKQPRHVASLNLLTVALMSMGRFAEAEQFISKAIQLDQRSDVSFYNYGLISKQLKKPHQALEQFNRSLNINPNTPETWNNRGTVFNDLGQFDFAVHDFEKATLLNRNYADAYANKGKALAQLKRHDEAVVAYDKALALKPTSTEAWLGRGNACNDLNRHDDALAAFDGALALKPDLAAAWLGRGNGLSYLDRYDDALSAYDKALALDPDLAEAWLGRGNVLCELDRDDEAFAAFDKALALDPGLSGAWVGRGNLLYDLDRHEEAIDGYNRALALNPQSAAAWLGRGNVASSLQHFEEALAAYDNALAQKPDLAEAWLGRASILCNASRYEEAIAASDKALELKPGLDMAHGLRLSARMMVCDWKDFSEECDWVIRSLRSGRISGEPFPFLSIPSCTAEDQLAGTLLWTKKKFRSARPAAAVTERPRSGKIRVGYVSADLRQHPVSYLIAGMFECHDKSRFETFGISLGPDDGSDMRRRLAAAFDTFVDASQLRDDQIVAKIRELAIDILVDLNGHTRGQRLAIFSRRAAPIQVHYLGFPGTLGCDFIDYLLADSTAIPPSADKYYTEKIVRLPHSFLATDDKRQMSDRVFTRQECGLPEQGFVYCCFNNSYKMSPGMFDAWMRVLRRVEGSVVWLRQDSPATAANLRAEAARRGIDAGRLVFAERLESPADHLARHRLADLFIDTLPYNAHTTACDALWSGLPVLTQIGETFAGRVAASLLEAIDMPELIARSPEAYESLAVELAGDAAKLTRIRDRLARNRLATPLFNTRLFTRHVEAAYEAMHRRHQAGHPPEPIDIAAPES
jgi:predicted O-linked N-acetylglucosamine transferase (SPINDLY family)